MYFQYQREIKPKMEIGLKEILQEKDPAHPPKPHKSHRSSMSEMEFQVARALKRKRSYGSKLITLSNIVPTFEEKLHEPLNKYASMINQ